MSAAGPSASSSASHLVQRKAKRVGVSSDVFSLPHVIGAEHLAGLRPMSPVLQQGECSFQRFHNVRKGRDLVVKWDGRISC